MLPFIITSSAITIHFPDGPMSIVSENPSFQDVHLAILNKEFQLAKELMSPRTVIQEMIKPIYDGLDQTGESVITIEGDIVYWNGNPTSGYVVDQILRMREEGESIGPLVRFLEKLYQNPSQTARDELYLFMEKSGLSLTEDGDVVCYKRVRHDFFDFYTGTMDNSPGNVLVYDRDKIDTNRHNTCSNGLHVCAASYLNNYHGGDGRTLRVVVDPRHFVTIPSDYNNAKARVEQYRVVDDLGAGYSGQKNAEAKKRTVDRTVNLDLVSADTVTNIFEVAWNKAQGDGAFKANKPENVHEAYEIASQLIESYKITGPGTEDSVATPRFLRDCIVGDGDKMTNDQLRSWFEGRRKIIEKVFENFFIVGRFGTPKSAHYGFSGKL